MAFKTGGKKTTYIQDNGYCEKTYTIYCAVESVTDICVYKMFDTNGKECNITIAAEDDTDGKGNRSLIDCLYCLKYGISENNLYDNQKIIITEMTKEEMKNIFGR